MVIIHQHNFSVTIHNASLDDRTEMKIWCKDYVGQSTEKWGYVYDLDGTACFYFNTEADATLFKLTWL